MDDPDNPARVVAARPNAVADGRASPLPHIEAFSAFYREFLPTLVAFLMWQGAALVDATDIAHETMTRAYRDWDRIDHHEAWARTVASREYVRRIASIREDPVDQVPDGNPLLRGDFDATAFEQRNEVLGLLALLPSRQRQVMAWTYDGYGPEDIAKELKIKSATVRSNLRKARRALAAHLEARQAHDG